MFASDLCKLIARNSYHGEKWRAEKLLCDRIDMQAISGRSCHVAHDSIAGIVVRERGLGGRCDAPGKRKRLDRVRGQQQIDLALPRKSARSLVKRAWALKR